MKTVQSILATIAVFVCFAGAARAQTTFSNTNPIAIPNVGTASPYPSTITVSGLSGNVVKVTATLNGYSHTHPGDVGVLLVSPSGASVDLMDQCSGPSAAVNANLTFDDAAANGFPFRVTSGTYRPTQCSSATYSAPAPGAPYGTALAALVGGTPNGIWKLFVQDFAASNSGSFSGGWSVTITSNTSPGSLQFSSATYSGNEGTTPTVTVTRTNGYTGAVTIDYATMNVSAAGGATCGVVGVDYVSANGTLTFGDGVASQSFPIQLCSDAVFDPNETLMITAFNPTGGATSGSPAAASLTINDVPPPAVQFSTTSYSGNQGTTATITVTRMGDPNVAVMVDYAATNGTAIGGGACGAGVDYVNTSGTLTFGSGITSQTFAVPLCSDAGVDADETLNLTLSNPTGLASLGTNSSATLTIAGPIPVVQFSAANYSVAESVPRLFLTVVRSGASGTMTVDYATTNGTATGGTACGPGIDYITNTGTLSLSSNGGYAIVITPCHDTIQDGDKNFTVTLSNPTGGGQIDSPNPATVTIIDDNLPPTTLTVNSTNDVNDGVCDASHCSLREAIAAAAVNNTTINFSPLFNSPQTIVLTSGLLIDKSLIITGPGANLLTISGNNTVPNVLAVGTMLSLGQTVYVTLSGLTIANGNGGSNLSSGLINRGTLTLIGCTVSGNKNSNTEGSGGGVYSDGTMSITNSTITGNANSVGHVGDGGGGVFNIGTMTITNSTISGNSGFASLGMVPDGSAPGPEGDLQGCGGGIMNRNVLTILNSTITGNTTSGPLGAGGIRSFGTTKIQNSIVAGNTGSATTFQDVESTFTSQGNNLIGKSDGSTGFTNGVNGDQLGTNATPLNALLAPLGNYGGPTMTHALLANSPAVNAGNSSASPATDQRGYLRSGISDIGAFEFGGTLPILQILSITHAANGHIILQCLGVPNQVNDLQVSPDLSAGSFAPISPAPPAADGTGAFTYDDAGAVGLTKRFYRLTSP